METGCPCFGAAGVAVDWVAELAEVEVGVTAGAAAEDGAEAEPGTLADDAAGTAKAEAEGGDHVDGEAADPTDGICEEVDVADVWGSEGGGAETDGAVVCAI